MKKIKSITILSIMTALALTACSSNTPSDTDNTDVDILYTKIGALSANLYNRGLPAAVSNGFIYYMGTDGYYEYDPVDKTSAKVYDLSESNSEEGERKICPQYNVVDNGFVVGEKGKVQYLNYNGEVLSEYDFPECEINEWLYAYEDRFYHIDHVFDTKTEKSTRLFDESDGGGQGLFYELSEDWYIRVVPGYGYYEKISLKDNDAKVQTIELSDEFGYVCSVAVDLNSDIYINSLDEDKDIKTLYKIDAETNKTEVVDIAEETFFFAVLNGNIAYMDYYVGGENDNLYYNDTLVSDNVFRFTLLNEKYIIYTVQIITGTDEFGITRYTEDVYLYDIENGSTEQLKTVTK